ncbi:MAG: 50S ribosomal protein P1 [Thermoproteota archaeon]|nr:MAG: 50S ribosomal protein P1 [Candidatus Korarchaeota archaeon]RLG49485.1 MAG: 50S ribosomal protein P1 [Candidatus Korarchaeota archaeon]
MGLEYIYAALLLHELNKPVEEETIKKVLEAAGATPDPARAKVLVESLSEVNIEEVLKQAVAAPVAAAPAPAAKAEEEKPKEEKKEKEKKEEEEAALAGLSALFG